MDIVANFYRQIILQDLMGTFPEYVEQSDVDELAELVVAADEWVAMSDFVPWNDPRAMSRRFLLHMAHRYGIAADPELVEVLARNPVSL